MNAPHELPEWLAGDDEDDEPPVHRIVPAAGLSAPTTRAPASVFHLAERSIPTKLRASMTPTPQPVLVAASLADGVKRCTGHSYPDNRWTPAKQAKEEARRARQRPPKPDKQRFKLKGTRYVAGTEVGE